MNGATALPFVNTINPPNKTIMNRIGNSQNFFRTRMNIQSSARNDIGHVSSELVLEAVRTWTGWITLDPIAMC